MKKYIIWGLGLLLLNSSCDNFLTQEPKTKVTNLNYWKNETDVESAVYGMHRLFREVFGNVEHLYRQRGLPFDYMGSPFKSACTNQLQISFSLDHPCMSWSNEYKVIAQANLIIDNIHRASLPEDRYRFYLGQAYCIRAYVYFYILKTWGDAPLITGSEDVGMKARTPWQTLADFAINDLKQASEMLPPASALQEANGSAIDSKQIPSRGTAYAILTHLYAWKAALNQEPELNIEAIQAADQAINSGEYNLAQDPAEVCEKVLLGNSPEGIFELDYRNTTEDWKEYGLYIAGSCQKWPIEPLTTPSTRRRLMRINNTTVMQLFPDTTDQRRSEYFYKLDSMATVSTSTTQGGAYIQKWRHVIKYNGGDMDGRIKAYEDNEILIRLADIILLRAELYVKTGNTAGAVKDLNTIRRRAGATEYTATEGDLAEVIAREREKELFLENDIRYYDIIRNGAFREKLLGDFQTLTDQDVQDGALYLPVGLYAFNNNTLMTQTPYWKRNGFAN